MDTGDLKQTALNKVSINFRANEFASILGPSGSGKTTLLNIIGGLIPARSTSKKDSVEALRSEQKILNF